MIIIKNWYLPFLDVIGRPFLVQVYWIETGFPSATNGTIRDSPSTPTAFELGGGLNLGGSGNILIQFFLWWTQVLIKWCISGNLHIISNLIASCTLLCNASFRLWQVKIIPFISCVTFILSNACDAVPPHNPGLYSVILSPGMAIPSRHQDNSAGGLLDDESQCNVASMPGFNSGGSTEILTVSGATILID